MADEHLSFEERARRQGIPSSLRHSAVFLMESARSQAIDDCIKVVKARIKTWEGAVRDGENRVHGAAVAEGKLTELEVLVPRLEALKGST